MYGEEMTVEQIGAVIVIDNSVLGRMFCRLWVDSLAVFRTVSQQQILREQSNWCLGNTGPYTYDVNANVFDE